MIWLKIAHLVVNNNHSPGLSLDLTQRRHLPDPLKFCPLGPVGQTISCISGTIFGLKKVFPAFGQPKLIKKIWIVNGVIVATGKVIPIFRLP
jgi:hypothetical protein